MKEQKKNYCEPELKVARFSTQDIVRMSDGTATLADDFSGDESKGFDCGSF